MICLLGEVDVVSEGEVGFVGVLGELRVLAGHEASDNLLRQCACRTNCLNHQEAKTPSLQGPTTGPSAPSSVELPTWASWAK